jgi:excisionase family DNA binding protein
MLSLGEAARQADVSKTTIHRAIKSGRISALKNEGGTYSIDPAEISRAFGTAKRLVTVTAEQTETPSLSLEVVLLRERIAELQTDRDAWRTQAERLLLHPPAAPVAPPRSSWLPWRR